MNDILGHYVYIVDIVNGEFNAIYSEERRFAGFFAEDGGLCPVMKLTTARMD